jgi:hypothetical protein
MVGQNPIIRIITCQEKTHHRKIRNTERDINVKKTWIINPLSWILHPAEIKNTQRRTIPKGYIPTRYLCKKKANSLPWMACRKRKSRLPSVQMFDALSTAAGSRQLVLLVHPHGERCFTFYNVFLRRMLHECTSRRHFPWLSVFRRCLILRMLDETDECDIVEPAYKNVFWL